MGDWEGERRREAKELSGCEKTWGLGCEDGEGCEGGLGVGVLREKSQGPVNKFLKEMRFIWGVPFKREAGKVGR